MILKKKKQYLIDESVKKAYQNLPVGEILSENTQINIINDTMFAITTITVNGLIT